MSAVAQRGARPPSQPPALVQQAAKRPASPEPLLQTESLKRPKVRAVRLCSIRALGPVIRILQLYLYVSRAFCCVLRALATDTVSEALKGPGRETVLNTRSPSPLFLDTSRGSVWSAPLWAVLCVSSISATPGQIARALCVSQ